MTPAEQREEDLKFLIRHPSGRRFLRRMFIDSGVWRSSFNSDPLVMARNEGRKSYAIELFNEIAFIEPRVIRGFVEPEVAGCDTEEPS